jgi:oligo-1,6-glucosidase
LAEYERLQNTGGDLNNSSKTRKRVARDNGRTPFQWDDSENGGFSTAEPWLKVNDHVYLNAAAGKKDQIQC